MRRRVCVLRRPVRWSRWVTPEDIADDAALGSTLFKWVPGYCSVHGCPTANNAELVRNVLPLEDPRCPTLVLGRVLRKRKWTPVDGTCDQESLVIGNFDSHDAVKFKTYYQCLLSLNVCLPLAGHIPSRQPVYFYKCLLAGLAVGPGLRSEEYNKLREAGKRA